MSNNLRDGGHRLAQKIKAYYDAQARVIEAEQELTYVRSKLPKKPSGDVVRYDDALDYKIGRDTIAIVEAKIADAKTDVKTAEQGIRELLPMKGQMIQVPGYRVGWFDGELNALGLPTTGSLKIVQA
jgi:hypothetical protein